MAIRVKDAAAATTKFVTNAGMAQNSYKDGVTAGAPAWLANTKASGQTWALGVQEAASNGRFANGISPDSQAKYVNRATSVGPGRYAAGVQTAGPAWQNAVTPYLQTIANLNLPARQPKGSPANMQRSTMVAAALRLKKVPNGQ